MLVFYLDHSYKQARCRSKKSDYCSTETNASHLDIKSLNQPGGSHTESHKNQRKITCSAVLLVLFVGLSRVPTATADALKSVNVDPSTEFECDP